MGESLFQKRQNGQLNNGEKLKCTYWIVVDVLDAWIGVFNASSAVLNACIGVMNVSSAVLNAWIGVLNVSSAVLNAWIGVSNACSVVLNGVSVGVLNDWIGVLNDWSGVLNTWIGVLNYWIGVLNIWTDMFAYLEQNNKHSTYQPQPDKYFFFFLLIRSLEPIRICAIQIPF